VGINGWDTKGANRGFAVIWEIVLTFILAGCKKGTAHQRKRHLIAVIGKAHALRGSRAAVLKTISQRRRIYIHTYRQKKTEDRWCLKTVDAPL